MRLVVAGAFRGDDRHEVDSGASGGKLTEPFRAVRDDTKRETLLQTAEHFRHLGPRREFGVSRDQPIGEFRRKTDLCLPIMPSERSTDGDRRAK